jgi:methylenetetrahydrofolate dehydrogenase (NADP+)/methenyltetrahydrofolate cyclohydrolase
MQIIDGKALSKTIKEEIAAKVEKIKAAGKRTPHLAAVLIGEDPASQVYVRNKVRSCEQVGFSSTLIRRPSDTTEEEVLQIVEDLK